MQERKETGENPMDAQEAASETGDRDLVRRIVNYLGQKHHPALQSVQVDIEQGAVRLRGKLRTFYEKQLCISVCQRVAGVRRVVDELEVPSSGA